MRWQRLMARLADRLAVLGTDSMFGRIEASDKSSGEPNGGDEVRLLGDYRSKSGPRDR